MFIKELNRQKQYQYLLFVRDLSENLVQLLCQFQEISSESFICTYLDMCREGGTTQISSLSQFY